MHRQLLSHAGRERQRQTAECAQYDDGTWGQVTPSASSWNNRWRRWRQEEDTPLPLRWWVGKADVLRHSYGTYRAAILQNSHNLAEEMGNFVAIVRTYYDAVGSPYYPKLWWRSDRYQRLTQFEPCQKLEEQEGDEPGRFLLRDWLLR
jgi:hypothetical protein